MVGIDCNPELSLRLGCCGGENYSSSSASSSAESIKAEGCRLPIEKQITIFYNGQICVSDVTEFQEQARAIISMAKREMEEKKNNSNNNNNNKQHKYQQLQFPYKLQHQGLNPELLNQGLSMKRSLQRFLQKRKTRIAAVSPYNYRQHFLSSSMS